MSNRCANHLRQRPERHPVAIRRATSRDAGRSDPPTPRRTHWNSHDNRVLPTARHTRDGDQADPRLPPTVAWNSCLTKASSLSRPMNEASRPSARSAPRAPPTIRCALQSRMGVGTPFKLCSPASPKATVDCVALIVTSSTSTVPGSAADWIRAARLTRSPASKPALTPAHDATFPVTIPPRAVNVLSPCWRPYSTTAWTISSPARTHRAASSSLDDSAPHAATTASPMNFSTSPPYRSTTMSATWK